MFKAIKNTKPEPVKEVKKVEKKNTVVAKPVKPVLVQKKHHKKHHIKTEEEMDKENVQLDSLFLTIEEELVSKDTKKTT